jgi:hypothetical protein
VPRRRLRQRTLFAAAKAERAISMRCTCPRRVEFLNTMLICAWHGESSLRSSRVVHEKIRTQAWQPTLDMCRTTDVETIGEARLALATTRQRLATVTYL